MDEENMLVMPILNGCGCQLRTCCKKNTTRCGIETFGYVYSTFTGDATNIPAGTAIPFNNNGPLQGITHIVGSESVTVTSAGTYQIDYSAFISAGVQSSLALAVNGVIDPSTNISALVAVGELSGTAMLSLAAGDVITLVNNSALPFTLATSPSIGAQLNIIQLR